MNPNDDLGRPYGANGGQDPWFYLGSRTFNTGRYKVSLTSNGGGRKDIPAPSRIGQDFSKTHSTETPDLIEPIVGWRSWGYAASYGERVLISPHQKSLWSARLGSMEAVCIHSTASQRLACQCGINAFDKKDHISDRDYYKQPIVGEVEMWGEVQSYERGYRSQFARPKRIWATNEKYLEAAKEIAISWGISCEGILDLTPVKPELDPQVAKKEKTRGWPLLAVAFCAMATAIAAPWVLQGFTWLALFAISAGLYGLGLILILITSRYLVSKRLIRFLDNNGASACFCLIVASVMIHDFSNLITRQTPTAPVSEVIKAAEKLGAPVVFESTQSMPRSITLDLDLSETLAETYYMAPLPQAIAKEVLSADSMIQWKKNQEACEIVRRVQWCIVGKGDKTQVWAVPVKKT